MDPTPTEPRERLRRVMPWALGILAIVALVWSASLLRTFQETAARLGPGQRLATLALAPNAAQARSALQDWVARDVTRFAREAIAIDNDFVPAYVLSGILICLWAAAIARPSWIYVLIIILCFVGAGLFDVRENSTLALMIDLAPNVAEPLLDRARNAAIGKFVLFLFGVIGTLVIVGAALRRLAGRRTSYDHEDLRTFDDLIKLETTRVFSRVQDREKDSPQVRDNTAADESRVVFRAADVIGLALSGGGIRSATFNLGLLEGMHGLNLLRLFDYLSTVSGGGYVGSFWSEYLARHDPKSPPDLFPSHQSRDPGIHDQVDSPQERHVREFSRFLSPRWGFFEVETWTAIVALVSGLVPAVAIALAVIGLALVGWLSITFSLALGSPWPWIEIVGITACILILFERMWHSVKAESAGLAGLNSTTQSIAVGLARYVFFAVLALVVVALLQSFVPRAYQSVATYETPLIFSDGSMMAAPGAGRFEQWWSVILHSDRARWVFSPRLFDYAIVWFAAAMLFIVARLSYSLSPWQWHRETLAAYDRVLMRLLGVAAFWAAIAVVWHLVINTEQVVTLALAGAASGGAFAALRNWIGVGLRQPHESGLTTRLKPYLPQILAYLTIVVTAVLVGRLLVIAGRTDWFAWWTATAVMMIVALVGLFIDPANYGLHAFYRERISRAYAGASNLGRDEKAEHNRATEPRRGDDRRISELRDRPLHLVCCAANDLSGDIVQTLGRGARSAVLSKFGLSLGGSWAETPDVFLGSAITASAAAFNSNMGMVSVRVGPAVSFLMTALNLRLGLWLRHPAAGVERFRRWPGLLLYREMFSLTSASGTITNGKVPLFMRDIHLSDGGHFENLALYELVRRHCRYILVSDCGSDPTVAFDDLGNALRRIREDFGVDITIDVDPLRPDPTTRLSMQHVAIGAIHYSPTDRGILLYVKPTLTGDEPPDVGQYKTRNAAFPHETTGDQFYDEAQYESYRRLGIHAAESIFDFVPPNPVVEPAAGGGPASTTARVSVRPLTADWVFAEAFHRWGPTPPGLADKVLEMTKRFGELEMQLQHQSRLELLAEVFPELDYVDKPDGKARDARKIAVTAADLPFLLRVTQLMEDVWIACELDEWWDHKLNLGWVNLFARWATAPSFRFWWPLFAPMYSPGFRDFINDRFATPVSDGDAKSVKSYVPQRGRVERFEPGGRAGLAEIWWKKRSTQPHNWDGRTLYQNVISLPMPDKKTADIQVGIAAVTMASNGRDVGWTSNDFFVPPSLWGASIGWHFLVGLLNDLTKHGFHDCYVIVKAVQQDAQHRFAFDDRHSFIKQYRKIGFRQQNTGRLITHKKRNEEMLDSLGFHMQDDTLFTLNLPQWFERRGSF